MKRTPLKPSKILPRRLAPMRKRTIRQSIAARSAREQSCTLCFPGCVNDRATVVLCHLRQFGGGGTGIKPDDAEAVYGCAHCHDQLDGRTQYDNDFDLWEHIARAIVRTQRVMRSKGVLIFKGES